MKVSNADAERFAAGRPERISAVLIYGPDDGLIRERSDRLLAGVVEDPRDPFRVVDLPAGEILKDPARLPDEAAAIAMTGGRRVVRLRDATDALAAIIGPLLETPAGDALILVEAGELPARSALRKLFEGADRGAALACYRDDERSLPAVISGQLAADGLTASHDALAYLAGNLGGDRQVTRRELEKLALYKGAGEISLADAQACVGDTAALGLDDLVYAMAEGDAAGLERAVTRSLQEGASAVALLRAAARHLQRLHLAVGLVRQGAAPEAAVKQLRPPVFWKLAGRFRSQLKAWQPERIAFALARLLEAETACKKTGAPAELLASRTLFAITARARRPAA